MELDTRPIILLRNNMHAAIESISNLCVGEVAVTTDKEMKISITSDSNVEELKPVDDPGVDNNVH